MHKPPCLRRGDTIGVVAPAGAIDDAALQRGVAFLEAAGFRVRLGAAVAERVRYLAGSDAARAEDLAVMVRDPSVAAVFAARGGYGSGRLLPRLDPRLFRAHPKAVVGHSDLTFLLNDLVQRAELVSFHGPMVSWFAEKPEAVSDLLTRLAGGGADSAEAPLVLREGRADGPLIGGCLSIVTAMLGTRFAVETKGRLLFLEDVNEQPFRIDRMLTQLKQAGAFDGIAGILFGEMPGCFEDAGVTLADLVADICGDGDYPIVSGLPSGHGSGTLTLPLGLPARLSGSTLTFLEPAVDSSAR